MSYDIEAVEEPKRLDGPIQASIYVQHLLREFLTENIVAWRAMAEGTEDQATRAELLMVADVAQQMATTLRASQAQLAKAESRIVTPPSLLGRG